ncbi:VPA1267 family protein [Marinobacter sp. BW6]|uniref:VPA1267 family protein n=1 Tax=Marinobacter sp. BW6 TaxID=2592624 RepID=UPI0023DDFE62|nr:VPA1267 family protein [Marinobacter sp. BW6]
MPSPQEQGRIYLENFHRWAKSMSDDDFRQIVYAPKGILNRQKVKELAGLSDQAIKKNEKVKAVLKALEDQLRERGVLPPLTEVGKQSLATPKRYDASSKKHALDHGRLGKLEAENQDLKVQFEKLQQENARLKARLAAHQETVDAVNDGLSVFLKCPS